MAEVLIIEPDKLLADTYRQALTCSGHKVRVCHQAQLSINIIDEQKPDVIVLELQLVSHGGIEFIYELRSYKEWQHIPIIVHTLVPSDIFIDNTQRMNELGISHYLYKPSTNLVQLNRSVNQAHSLAIK